MVRVALAMAPLRMPVFAAIAGANHANPMRSIAKITMLNAGTWSEIVFSFEPTPAILMRSVFLAGFMGVVGGFLPAIRAARVSPIEAMRA